MGFMDELRKLTQPYDDDNDFFEGADSSLREAPAPSAAQREFENVFGNEPAGKPEPEERREEKAEQRLVESDWAISRNDGAFFSDPVWITFRGDNVFDADNWSVEK